MTKVYPQSRYNFFVPKARDLRYRAKRDACSTKAYQQHEAMFGSVSGNEMVNFFWDRMTRTRGKVIPLHVANQIMAALFFVYIEYHESNNPSVKF